MVCHLRYYFLLKSLEFGKETLKLGIYRLTKISLDGNSFPSGNIRSLNI